MDYKVLELMYYQVFASTISSTSASFRKDCTGEKYYLCLRYFLRNKIIQINKNSTIPKYKNQIPASVFQQSFSISCGIEDRNPISTV